MRVMITGGTGYIGGAVLRALEVRGHEAVATVRAPASASKLPAALQDAAVVAPLEDLAAIRAAAAGCDGVIHLAFDHALQRDATVSPAVGLQRALDKEFGVLGAFAEALDGSDRPLVSASACGILGDTGPAAVTEEHPSPPGFMPALRRTAEDQVSAMAARRVRSSVVRVPLMTHTRGGGGVLSRMKATAAERGFSGYIGEGANRLSSVNVADLAELFVLALEAAPAGSIYNGAGGDVSTLELAQALSVGAVPVRSVTVEEAREVWGPFAAGLLSINNRCSNDKARRELGWRPYEQSASLQEDLAS